MISSLLLSLPLTGALQTWTAFVVTSSPSSVVVIPGNTTQAPVPFLAYVGTLLAVDKTAAIEQTTQYLESLKDCR